MRCRLNSSGKSGLGETEFFLGANLIRPANHFRSCESNRNPPKPTVEAHKAMESYQLPDEFVQDAELFEFLLPTFSESVKAAWRSVIAMRRANG